MNTTHIESWKNKKVFEIQLQGNLKELQDGYPSHWEMFINFVNFLNKNNYNPKSILDVASGCGTYSELCNLHFKDLDYTGMDYAQEAVDLAKEKWNRNFIVGDYKELTKEEVQKYDILHACSLHNVLPNGDEALEFFLQLRPKFMILGKLLTTHTQSNYRIYKAYGEIDTYLYYHNINNIKKLFKEYGYTTYCEQGELPINFLLIRK